MANKHLTEDEIKYTVNVESSNAQKKIHELEQQTKKLRSENKQRLLQMIKMEAAGKKETDTYKNLKKQYSETGKEIKNLTSQISEHTSKINVLDMTMVQLKKRQKELQRELGNTSKNLNPEAYKVLESRLSEVNERIVSLKQDARSLGEVLKSDSFVDVLSANAMTKGAELLGKMIRSFTDSISEFASKGIEMAEAADGVTKAFKDMDKPDLLDNLRKATKGTVNDVQLMTAAVQAKDFRIPLEDLGKYLQFAQLKAQQTGQSVDYMTNSIVTGLGRKSPLILDNLGISAAEISEKTKETGDFMKAVAEIVDTQLAEAGETYISAADRAAQKTVELENAQKKLGDLLLPLKEEWDAAYGDIQMNIISVVSWLLKNKGAVETLTICVTVFTAVTLAARAAMIAHATATAKATVVSKAWNVIVATGTTLLKALQAVLLLATGRIDKARVAWAAMNTTMKASVFGLVATGVALLAMKLWDMHQKQTLAAKSAQELADLEKGVTKQVNEAKSKIKLLNDTMRDEHTSMVRRQEALNELKRIIPGYNGMLSKEGKLIRDNKSAIDAYNLSLEQSIKLKAYQDKLEELYKRQSDQEDARDKAQQNKYKAQQKLRTANAANTIAHSQGKLATSGMNALSSGMDSNVKNAQGNLSRANTVLTEATSELATTNSQIASITKKINSITGTIKPPKEANPDPVPNPDKDTGKGGHTTTAPNPDDIASKKFSSDRQADIDEANRSYQQDVNNWNMALAQKKVSQEKYDLAMGALKTQHTANILAIETSYTQRSQDIDIKDAEKKKSLQDAQLKNQQAAEQKHFDQQVEAENAYQEALAKVMEQGGVKVELTMEQERDEKLAILSGYYQAALNLAQQNGEDVTALEKAYADAQAQIQEEYETKRVEKLAQDAEKQKQARESLGFDKQSEYDQQLEQLQQALDNQYITQEEYEKKVQQLKRDSYMKQAQYYTNLFSGAVTALQDAEMANVDAKYDAEIKAAEGNTELQEKLEKKKANEKLKIQKKYADVNFAMQVAQIVSTTAVSIMKAYADLGPVAGSIAAALMGVTGAAQLVVANAERQKVKRMTMSNAGGSSSSASGARVASGRESGGSIDVEREQDGKRFHAKYDPDKRGFIDKPTVIVGEGPRGKSKEWVASNAAVENPTVAPLLNIIDQAQRAGNIRTFDLGKYLMAMQGKALGGYVDADALKKTSGGFSKNLGTYSEKPREVSGNAYLRNEEALTSLLTDLRDNGIRAYVSLSDLDAKQQIRNQARKYATK